MRKIFLFISVLFLAVTANAKEVTISSGTTNIFRTAVDECTDAENTIILNDDDAAFDNTGSYIAISHNLTIRAAEGKHPIIKPMVPIQISAGASVKFIGIKFDGSIIGSYDYLIRFNDDNANNELELDNCEFTAVAKACIKVKEAGKKAKSCIIKNCNFHDNSNIAFFNNAGVIETLQIKDSEFSSFTGYPVISNVGSTASLSSLQIDACSFHANTGQIINNESSATISSCTINNSTFQNNSQRGILNQGTITSLQINSSKFSYFTAYPIIDNYNASIGKIKIDGSEFYNNAKYLINGEAKSHADSCIVTNCHFHNNARSSIFFAASSVEGTETCDGVIVKNSTFANNDMSASSCSVIEVRNYGSAIESNIEVSVDHCTFFNNSTSGDGYAAGVRSYKSTKVNISNCIFAHPTPSYERCATYCYGGNVTNCLTYNLTSGTNGHHSGPSLTNNKVGNPYFLSTDPENYDFTLWTTSPARGAGTEDSNIGDPNWNTDPSTHVATVNITADATNSLKAAIDAALPGDVIILAAGTYEESENISLDKEITIKAADGASPVVKPVGVFALGNAADVTIQNIKFDGSDQTASNFIYALDATNNSLTIDGCEFYSFENAVISATDSKLISTCTVNRCYFYNNTNSCICLKNTAEADLTVTNSTFANINASSVSAGIVESKTSAGKVKADHCTFYNCPVSSTGYAAIKFESSDITVSNNIIVMPTSTDNIRAIHLPDGKEVKNCLTYGYTYDSKSGIRYGVTQTACLPNTDPYFTDAASGDFSFPYNWSTGVLSPAFGAATDGKPLGAPRWFTNEVVPETDMATPYFLEGKIAKLSGNIYYSAADSLHYEDKVDCGSATWKLHIEEPCAIRATINYKTGSSSGAILALSVYNADEDQVDDAMTHSYYSEDGNKDLTGCVYIPVAGDYTFVLENTQSHSSAKINGITLSYMGGEVQEISTSADTSLPLDEAWFIGCTRDEDGITYPSSNTTSAWIKWNIATTETKFYDLTLNINTTYNHELAVNIYEDENEAPIATVSESYSSTHGSPLAIELGRVQLVGDKNYIAKVTNSANGSQAEVLSLVFKPVTSLVVELPNTIPFINAVLSDKAHITDGKLYFNEIGDTNPQGQWAQWKVTTNHNGLFLFTMNTESTNEQDYKIAIWNEAGTEVVDFCEASLGSGTKVLTHYFNLAAGNYFVKVENTRSYSRGHLTSFVVTEPESSSIITLSEEATSNSDWSAKVNDGTYDVQIIRTIKAGMYNTFCLPFAVSSSMVKQIFGKDVQIRTLNEATLESDFVLTLNFAEASDIHPGTPVLIQTSRDIVNPAFVGVQFGIAAPSATTKTNANFTGTFVKTSLEANENILFLGANNKLYFPTATVDIYGMRGWFIVHDVPGGAPAIRGARIVTPNNMPTEIELVKSEEPKANSQKLIENGQLVIIRDGVRYNAMGVRVK